MSLHWQWSLNTLISTHHPYPYLSVLWNGVKCVIRRRRCQAGTLPAKHEFIPIAMCKTSHIIAMGYCYAHIANSLGSAFYGVVQLWPSSCLTDHAYPCAMRAMPPVVSLWLLLHTVNHHSSFSTFFYHEICVLLTCLNYAWFQFQPVVMFEVWLITAINVPHWTLPPVVIWVGLKRCK